MAEVTQEGVHIRRENDMPTHVIIRDSKLRVPVIFRLTVEDQDELARLIE